MRDRPLPLRLRLTLWYTAAMGLMLLLFAVFLYWQVRRGLYSQLDAGLQLAANQALISVAPADGQPAFDLNADNPAALRNLSDDFVIYLLAADGRVLDVLSAGDRPPLSPAQPGYRTLLAEGDQWRVYGQALPFAGASGLILVAQELDPLLATLAGLRAQILWGLPLALVIAGAGGFFLASRALRPIDRIARTAQQISAGDMSRRLHYQGPADEVGRLAATFDAMLDRLQAAFARERRFTADAAHELRTPLTALKGRIGVTLSRSRRPETYVETLQVLEEQVDRLIRLSNDLLFIARLDQARPGAEQIAPNLHPIEATGFLAAVTEQVRPLAAAKGVILQESAPAGLTLRGDMDLLIRLFLNLLDNAVRHTPEHGRVAISAAPGAAGVEVTVSDSGPGIPPEHLPHLFERFYRVESDRSRLGQPDQQGGAGLGLAIAYEIARAHGGGITVESILGKGTTFIVHLPAPLNPASSAS